MSFRVIVFSREILLGEDVSRELHRERREALREVAVHDVGGEGAEDARPVDARVLVEALVLGDDERLLHLLRDFLELDERAALEAELGDEASVGGEELARLTRLEGVELGGIGARTFAADEAPRGPGETDAEGEREKAGEQRPARELGSRAPEARAEGEGSHIRVKC